jgi:hypothetical protein
MTFLFKYQERNHGIYICKNRKKCKERGANYKK